MANLKSFLPAAILSSLSLIGFSQRQDVRELEDKFAGNYKTLTVEIDAKKRLAEETHFSYLFVFDARADRSKLGITRAGEKVTDRKIVLPAEMGAYLTSKINKLVRPVSGSSDTLLLVINNCWLFQTFWDASFFKGQVLGLGNKDLMANCYLSAECYTSEKDKMNLLGTIDTVFSRKGWLAGISDELLEKSLSGVIAICDSLFNNSKRTEVDYGGFSQQQQEKYKYPILLHPVPASGIYYTYTDFLNDRPHPASVDIYYKNQKRYIKGEGISDSLLTKVWGYCDGKNIYMNITGGFYKLNRAENTFDLMGPQVVEYKNSLFSRLLYGSVSYAVLDVISPMDVIGLTDNSIERIETLKYYQMNIRDGILR